MASVQFLSVCFESREGDVPGNVGRATTLIRDDFRERGRADVVVLPELFTSGYCSLDLGPYAENLDSPTVRNFVALSAELDTIIAWGFAERPAKAAAGDRRVYNSVG